MAYKGKFIDRTPIICPAGKIVTSDTKLPDCLKCYSLVDQIDAVKHELNAKEKEEISYKARRASNTRNQGIYTECSAALRPPDRTNYQAIINELRNTSFRSYWDRQLGRIRDPVGGLPSGMDPQTTTFGKHYIREYGVKELINPPKTVYEVLWDSQDGHVMYRKTHNDYNPGEQINRKYLELAFDPKRTYGHKTIYDPRGIWVDCACTWHVNEPVVTASQMQANMAARTKPQLGKCLTPNNNIDCVPKGFTFLKPCDRSMCGMEELLRDSDVEICLFRRDFNDWIKHVNELRCYIKRRKGVFLELKDLYNSFLFYDTEKKGWVPVDMVYEICTCHNLNFNHEKMNALTLLIGVQQDDYMNYKGFIDLIDFNSPMPRIVKVRDIPEKNTQYITTNMAARCDYLTMDNTGVPTAGVPSIRTDLQRPIARPGQCKADMASLGDETTVAAVINPSIFANYGLSHRDFFLPRKPEFIQQLFEKLGYTFFDNTFEELWKIGVKLDKTGLVCVDTFKLLLKEAIPPPNLLEEKTQCT